MRLNFTVLENWEGPSSPEHLSTKFSANNMWVWILLWKDQCFSAKKRWVGVICECAKTRYLADTIAVHHGEWGGNKSEGGWHLPGGWICDLTGDGGGVTSRGRAKLAKVSSSRNMVCFISFQRQQSTDSPRLVKPFGEVLNVLIDVDARRHKTRDHQFLNESVPARVSCSGFISRNDNETAWSFSSWDFIIVAHRGNTNLHLADTVVQICFVITHFPRRGFLSIAPFVCCPVLSIEKLKRKRTILNVALAFVANVKVPSHV